MSASPLPRGRHGLSREEVRASQSARLQRALIDVVGERGYAGTQVGEIAKRAGVSLQTFYGLYANKRECYVAAYDAALVELMEATGAAQAQLAPDAPGLERINALVAAYLDFIAQDAPRAKTVLVEFYGAADVLEDRWAKTRVNFVEAAVALLHTDTPFFRFAAEAYLGSVSSMVTHYARTGRSSELPELKEPFSRLAEILLPHANDEMPG